MNERERLTQKAGVLRAVKDAEDAARLNEQYEYNQRKSRLVHLMRERLLALKRSYEGSVHLSLHEVQGRLSTDFRIQVLDGSPLLRKPFAEITVYVTDHYRLDIKAGNLSPHVVLPSIADASDPELVIEVLRTIAADFLVKRPSLPYHFPEWYTVLITICAALVGVACLIAATFVAGWWGLFIGALVGFGVFHLLRHVGPVLVLLATGLAIAGGILGVVERL